MAEWWGRDTAELHPYFELERSEREETKSSFYALGEELLGVLLSFLSFSDDRFFSAAKVEIAVFLTRPDLSRHKTIKSIAIWTGLPLIEIKKLIRELYLSGFNAENMPAVHQHLSLILGFLSRGNKMEDSAMRGEILLHLVKVKSSNHNNLESIGRFAKPDPTGIGGASRQHVHDAVKEFHLICPTFKSISTNSNKSHK